MQFSDFLQRVETEIRARGVATTEIALARDPSHGDAWTWRCLNRSVRIEPGETLNFACLVWMEDGDERRRAPALIDPATSTLIARKIIRGLRGGVRGRFVPSTRPL